MFDPGDDARARATGERTVAHAYTTNGIGTTIHARA